MELIRDPKFNFIGRKKIFLTISLTLLALSIVAIAVKGIPLGVDFRGGTLVYLKMAEKPNPDALREEMRTAGMHDARIQRYGAEANNEVLIALEGSSTSDEALEQGRNTIVQALGKNAPQDKRDLNNVGRAVVAAYLLERDPLRAGTDAEQRYNELANSILTFRDAPPRGGLVKSLDELNGVVPAEAVNVLKEGFYAGPFAVRQVEIVGPQVGSQLRHQALLATLYSLGGMLIYLWFRFELVYGATAVLAVFHDVIITLGIFSIFNIEISLTVIAALLTLIGYSMNDTIVIFDRVRENLRLMRRESYGELVNTSVNQTLNRTFLTAGPTFLTLLALLIFGGEVLQGFALALVIGIVLGTFSSFGFAAPLLVIYRERWGDNAGRRSSAELTPARSSSARK